ACEAEAVGVLARVAGHPVQEVDDRVALRHREARRQEDEAAALTAWEDALQQRAAARRRAVHVESWERKCRGYKQCGHVTIVGRRALSPRCSSVQRTLALQ